MSSNKNQSKGMNKLAANVVGEALAKSLAVGKAKREPEPEPEIDETEEPDSDEPDSDEPESEPAPLPTIEGATVLERGEDGILKIERVVPVPGTKITFKVVVFHGEHEGEVFEAKNKSEVKAWLKGKSGPAFVLGQGAEHAAAKSVCYLERVVDSTAGKIEALRRAAGKFAVSYDAELAVHMAAIQAATAALVELSEKCGLITTVVEGDETEGDETEGDETDK